MSTPTEPDTPALVLAPTPNARVEISAAGHQVVIDAPEPMGEVAALAMEVFAATDHPAVTGGYGTSVGFTTTEAAGPLPAALTLPAHLTDPECRHGRRRR